MDGHVPLIIIARVMEASEVGHLELWEDAGGWLPLDNDKKPCESLPFCFNLMNFLNI